MQVEYKSYYQWVPFVLFLQACLFYTPHALFKLAEGGKVTFSRISVFLKVAAIISGLHEPGALLHEDERMNRTTALAKFFNSSLNTHNYWAIRMLLCELLFFVNVVFNIFLIDAFLGGEFSTYGLEVATFVGQDPQYRRDPMSRCELKTLSHIDKIDFSCPHPLKHKAFHIPCFQSVPSGDKVHLRKVWSVRHN